MKINILFLFSIIFLPSVVVTSCGDDDMTKNGNNSNHVVTANATLGEVSTRVAFTDTYSGSGQVNITTNWEANDKFNVLEGTSACTFSTTQSGTSSAAFISTDATVPTAETSWKAVVGDGAKASGSTITCGYDGQDGTLANLKKYNYIVAKGTGKTPLFDFSNGTRLTYFLRIKIGAGINYIQFCTGSWTITSNGNVATTASTNTVSTLILPQKSKVGQIVYLAVPAINYSISGLIITLFKSGFISNGSSMSQGKVVSKDFSTLGGHIATYEMSNLNLMYRPNSYDAVDLGAYGKWAPFDVGAINDLMYDGYHGGTYYAWGMIEPCYTSGTTTLNYAFDMSTYLCASGNSGTSLDPIFVSGCLLTGIQNTKFDVARVKWGLGWRMPTYDELSALASQCNPTWKTTYKGVTGYDGYSLTSNGNTIFFPLNGYRLDKNLSGADTEGNYWSGTFESGSKSIAKYLQYYKGTTSTSIYTSSSGRQYGFCVRPVYE